ncbi:hypothetical protein DL93DRAFT_2101178 [Clavulina sp. PMI_390]|nr:hypothetical protein DL93DRAFT_2101178 [Clavulina sp. PMI_390]
MSSSSNNNLPVADERPLPAGWIRVFDTSLNRFLYIFTWAQPVFTTWDHPSDLPPSLIPGNAGAGGAGFTIDARPPPQTSPYSYPASGNYSGFAPANSGGAYGGASGSNQGGRGRRGSGGGRGGGGRPSKFSDIIHFSRNGSWVPIGWI